MVGGLGCAIVAVLLEEGQRGGAGATLRHWVSMRSSASNVASWPVAESANRP